jgi:hypothetical protein
MHVVGHDDEADAARREAFELVIERSQHDPLGLVAV